MSDVWLPLGLALGSWAGFALGVLPFRNQSSHAMHDLQAETESSILDHLYPITVAFFIGYLALALLPHVLFHTESKAPLPAFAAGAIAMALLSRRILRRDPCCETGHQHDPVGLTFFLALSVCAINDGILIGLVHPPWLSGLNLGMAVHKVTSSFALALALGHWRYRGRRLFLLGLANGLISPVFFYVGGWMRAVSGAPMEALMAFSTGILAYTVLTGMLPHSRQMLKRKPSAWIGFLAALAISVYLGYLHHRMHGG